MVRRECRGWEKLSRNLILCDFSKSVLCFLVCKVKGLDHCMIFKSLLVCVSACLWEVGEEEMSLGLNILGHWERSVSCTYIGTDLSSWFDFCQSCPRKLPPPELLLLTKEGQTAHKPPTAREKTLAQWKARWGASLWVGDRVSKEVERTGLHPRLLGQGEVCGPHTGLCWASREQYLKGIVKNKCAVIALGRMGPVLLSSRHIISLGFFYCKVIAFSGLICYFCLQGKY